MSRLGYRRHPGRRLPWLAVFAVLVAGVSAEPDPGFQRISVAEGLSQRAVRALAEDRNGLLWLGSNDGLNRYDGRQITVYRAGTDGLPANWISSLASTSDGRLWAGTPAGLAVYRPEQDRFEQVELGFPSGESAAPPAIGALLATVEGGLWIGSDRGLVHWDGRRFNRLAFAEHGLAERLPVRALAADANDGLWIGSTRGLWHWSAARGRFSQPLWLAAEHDLREGEVHALLVDRNGGLWIGGGNSGLARHRPGTDRLQRWRPGELNSPGPESGLVYSLLQDDRGRLWLGTDIGIDLVSDPQAESPRFQPIRSRRHDPHRLGKGEVYGLLQSSDGSVWAGTWAEGVSRHHPFNQRFARFHADAPGGRTLPDDTVSYLAAEPGGWLLVGGPDGLYRLDPDSGRVQPEPATAGHYVLDVLAEPGGYLLATRNGVHRVGAANARPALPEALRRLSAFSLLQDGDRRWFGSFDGHLYLQDASGELLQQHVGLGWIGFIHLLDGERLLVGSQGLHWFARDDGRRLASLSGMQARTAGLAEELIACRLRTRDGRLWFGSYGAGLFEMLTDPTADVEAARFRRWGREHGLASESIIGLFEDAQGRLWLASNRGISQFDPASGRVRNHGSDEGVFAGGYYLHASAQLTDGRIAFGGPEGLTVFDPAAIGPAPPPPAPRLLSVTAAGRRLWSNAATFEQPLRLAAEQARELRIEFAAPYFVATEQLQVERRLDGLDLDWQRHLSPEFSLTYGQLPPGDYRFRLRIGNGDGVWHPDEAQLAFEVLPPWWAGTPARLAALLLIGLTLTVLYRGRIARLQRQQQRLEQLVEQRSAQLLESVAREREHEKLLVREKLATASQLTGGLAHEINNPTHFAALAAQNLQAELDRFRQFLIELAGDDAEPDVIAAFDARFDRLGEQLHTILEGNQRVAGIVADLRAFSKLDPPQPAPTQIAELLAATVRLAGARYRQRIDFELDLAADPPILCLPARLNQVFMNLVINACHAIEERSQREGGDYRGRLRVSSSLDRAPPDPGVRPAASIRATDTLPETVARMQQSEIRDAAAPNHPGLRPAASIRATDTLPETVARMQQSEIRDGDAPDHPGLRPAASIRATDPLPETVARMQQSEIRDSAAPDHPGVRPAASIRATDPLPETVARMQRSEIRGSPATAGDRGHLVISIEDNGCGIPIELQARIFEPFFTTKPEGVGTGLGLAVSRGIVSEHAGSLELESREGDGSCFRVRLPLARAS